MKLISLNKNPERYNYLSEMEYKDERFHGHQTALVIGVRATDGSWNKVYTAGDTEEEKIKIANDMLNDKSLILLEENITQLEDGKLVPRTVYYFPYYVADHSAYMPTVNYDQISGSCNTINNVKIEVLFVHPEGWYNRYVTFDWQTGNCSLMDFISDLEQAIEDNAAEINGDFFIASEDSENYNEGDIVLDFYDKSGQKYCIGHFSSRGFLDLVSSVRIIGIDTQIVKDEE